MDSRATEVDDPRTVDATPEDVTALYAWAKLQGAKYRDYSGSRREYRAQARYRTAKASLEREVQAQAEAERAGAEAENAAGASALAVSGDQGEVWKAHSMGAAARAAERLEAARRAELAARLAVVALREEREIAEAHASARRQAMLYEGTQIRLRELAGPQPYGDLQGADSSLHAAEQEMGFGTADGLQPFLFPGWQDFVAVHEPGTDGPRGEIGGAETLVTWDDLDCPPVLNDRNTPAWLFSAEILAHPEAAEEGARPNPAEDPTGETLFDSREQLAARWFALKGVFEDAGRELAALPAGEPTGVTTPLLAVFSLSGGVGKTSLAAAIARGLASRGKDVVLADTTSQGLLPIYFGLHELRPGIVHRMEPEGNAGVGTVSLVVHPGGRADGNSLQNEALAEEILRGIQGKGCHILDLATGMDWLLRRVADRHPMVLVPIAPDINSVISLNLIERLFRGITDSQRRPLLPVYVLNQFDASLPLHLDIREVFRRRLGDRLARIAIRRSPAVGEALAEGMTVLEYAPDDPVSQDYSSVVAWLTSIWEPAAEASRVLRWGEQ